MNGVKRELSVTATEQRSFDKEEWVKLRSKLATLLDNLTNVKGNLDLASERANELVNHGE